MTWYRPEDPTPREACPCCGYVTLAERGTCQICRVCFWEDDLLREAHHAYSMCNHMTLAEARANFAKCGASKSRWLGNVLPFAALAHIERRPVDLVDRFPPRAQCRCCGYISLPAVGEEWECAVCFWLDRGEPLHLTTTMNETLWIARARFARRAVVDARFERRPLPDDDAPVPTQPCPCCDHVTLVGGVDEAVCPLCFWPAYECTLAVGRARFADGLRVGPEEWFGRVDLEDCALFERRPSG